MGGLSPSTDPGARPAPAPRRLPPARVRPPVTGALFCIRQRPRLFIRHRSRAAFSARLFCVPPAPAAPGPLACLAAPGPGARFGVRCARFGVRPAPVAYYRHALWRLAAAKSGTGAGRTFPPGSFASPLRLPPRPARLSRRHALWRPVRALWRPARPGRLLPARALASGSGEIRHRSRADFSARLFCIHQRSPVYPAACAPAYLPCAPAACALWSPVSPARARPRRPIFSSFS